MSCLEKTRAAWTTVIIRGVIPMAVLVTACDAPAPPPTPPLAAPPAAAPEIPITASAVDAEALRSTARLLAGLEQADGAWTRHAELMDEIWAQVEERHLAPMRSWAGSQLTLADAQAPLYYPFSGPDLPSALQFFPAASSYVLVGLEPPGRIPDLADFAGEPLEAELERLRGGLANLAEAGYFVTKRMETDFVANRLEGVLPVLYIFLARAGLAPVAVEFITLDNDGTVIPLATATDRTATAVRIQVARHSRANETGARHSRANETGARHSRELYYFSRDLSNSGVAETPDFVAFLRGLGAFNTYMKSASYLLHMDDFTAHKEFLAGHAGAVLQDDSGIPLSALPAPEWQLRYFGTYTRTLPTYREWFQEDLKAVYEQAGIPPLPFAIGYHSKIGGSCLVWAERRRE